MCMYIYIYIYTREYIINVTEMYRLKKIGEREMISKGNQKGSPRDDVTIISLIRPPVHKQS